MRATHPILLLEWFVCSNPQAPDLTMDWYQGTHIDPDDLTIENQIGEGGFAKVDTSHNRQVYKGQYNNNDVAFKELTIPDGEQAANEVLQSVR